MNHETAAAQDQSPVTAPPQPGGEGTVTASSTRFGDIQVEKKSIITMVTPLLGFPDAHRFFLLPHRQDSPLMWFQALDDPDLAFVVVPPAAIVPEYQPPLWDLVQEDLQLSDRSDLELLLILTIPHGHPERMTANLLGPLAVNVNKRLAKQVPLNPLEYDSRWPVLREEQAR